MADDLKDVQEDDIEAMFATMKKKKSKKKSKKKKKKKSKDNDEDAGSDAGSDKDGENEESETATELYTYNEMLDRVFERLQSNNPELMHKKRYKLKSHIELPEGTWNWEDFLKKDHLNFKSIIVSKDEGKRASLRGERIDSNSAEVELFTGRYHQIRAQASHRGYPILGDVFYGGNAWDNEGVALHASHLSFHHPKTNEELSFDSETNRF